MSRQRANPPEWAEAFRKIIELEAKHGFNDSAVIGGLDRFRHRWQAEMAARAGESGESAFLLRQRYGEMPQEQRAAWANRWLRLIGDEAAAPEPSESSMPPTIPAPPVPPVGPEPVEGRAALRPPGPPAAPAHPSRGSGPTDVAPSQAGLAPSRTDAAPSPFPTGSPRTLAKPSPAYGIPPGGQTVDAPVDRLKGVNAKMAERLERLDVATVRDLLYLFPRRHDDYSNVVSISEVVPGRECTVVATVWESRVVAQGAKGRRKDTEAVLGDDTGNVRAIWFGQQYIARTLKPGSLVAISGKAEVFRGQPVFNSPVAYPAESEPAGIHTGRMVPVYPLTEGLRMHALRNLAWDALQNWLGGVEETLPPEVKDSEGLAGRMPLREAIFQAHFPDDPEIWQAARSRLAFDELLTLQLAVLSRRREAQAEVRGVAVRPVGGVVENFLRSLPFELTGAQARCIAEITQDMERGAPPMNRLLQGEVGSGKTVVALAALLAAAAAGFQGALMAPTELLAEQHFRSASRLLEGLARPVDEENLLSVYLEGLERPLTVGLLTGSVRAPVKRMLTAMAADGALDLVFGTQALIQEGVSIPGLALAVADEQHRFGVMQRSALRQRGGENPHTLIMSATPIPRTLSLTLYGDLDISTIDELPAGRQQVSTSWVPQERRADAYDFVRKQVAEGRQAFVVCPLIDESATIEARAATEEYERLSGEVFPDLRVGLLHGRMNSRDKDATLRRFSDAGLDVLVTTAVVEVGIDVPNASIMLIEGAERFGLAQLHQFRGRVGRGEHKSYCFLLPSGAQTGAAKERLSALERTNDGFQLAEIDLELRGPGDFFGTRQSGLPALRMALFSDRGLLESARALATRISAEDPELAAPEHSALAAQVARFISRASADAG